MMTIFLEGAISNNNYNEHSVVTIITLHNNFKTYFILMFAFNVHNNCRIIGARIIPGF